MGVATENSSMIGLKNTEGPKTEKSFGIGALMAKKTLLDKKKPGENTSINNKKRCLCSPTTHPGSFRCRLHRATTSSSGPNLIKTTETKKPGLSRFARDVSQGSDDSSLQPLYNSE